MNSANWTPAARAELDRLLEEHHARVLGSGADADEVIADLRRHVETELSRDPTATIDSAAVRRVLTPLLAGVDLGESHSIEIEGMMGRMKQTARRLRCRWLLWILWLVLPLATVGFELWTQICADMVADPLRSWAHVAAVLSVPVVLGVVLVRIERAPGESLGRFVTAIAFACGVAGYHALLLGQAVFFGVIGLLAFGLGLLALSPLLLTLSTSLALWRVRRFARAAGSMTRVWPALLAGVGMMLVLDARWILTGVALHQVGSRDSATYARGERLLRSSWTSESTLLDACVRHARFGLLDPLFNVTIGPAATPWEVRRVYFAATGKDFAAEANRSRSSRRWGDDFFFDEDRSTPGSARARTTPENLSLASSRFDGLASPDSLVGYVEWTAVVNNDRAWDLEGRATLQLPRGGVVSRVTLWINGEEREAAFGGRAQTIRAYEAVTARRRDPLLVTSAGPDRVDLRFFPVPRHGSMKFRIGISFPMAPDRDAAVASVELPRILESNLFLSEKFAHEVWYEAHAEPATVPAGLAQEKSPRGEIALRGSLSEALLTETTLRFRRDTRVRKVVAPFTGRDSTVVFQHLEPAGPDARPRLLLLDGTPRFLRQHAPQIESALRQGSGAGPLEVIVALEEPLSRSFNRPADAAAFLNAALRDGAFSAADGTKREIPRRAGFDNRAALADAVRRMAGTGGRVVWIHGTQPTPTSFESVLQVLARRDAALTILELAPESDRVRDWGGLEEKLSLRSELLSAAKLELALGAGDSWEVVRGAEPKQTPSGGEAAPASRHLTRLWVADEVMRLVRADPGARDAAMRLAIEHQLVTPLSGAVVLETQQQYQEHGLKPADPKTVPVVPEPQTYAFMLAAMIGVLAWRRWKLRSRHA